MPHLPRPLLALVKKVKNLMSTRFVRLSLLFAFVLLTLGGPEPLLSAQKSPVPPEVPGNAFHLYYFNDFHGFANPAPAGKGLQEQGGAAWLAARVEQLRRQQPGLFLAAGDMIQGDTWANFSQGHAAIALLNQVRIDALVVGNHEFDFGQKVLKQRI